MPDMDSPPSGTGRIQIQFMNEFKEKWEWASAGSDAKNVPSVASLGWAGQRGMLLQSEGTTTIAVAG